MAAVLLLALLSVPSTAVGASTTISPATLPAATVGVAYGATITVSGPRSPYTIRVTQGSLPSGLRLTGTSLTGTPTTAAIFAFTITAYASNGQPAASKVYSIAVAPAPPPPATSISPSSLPNGTVGTVYSQVLSVSGSKPPYTVRVTQGALPPGLTLTSGGSLSGTPTTSGAYSFTVSAFDAAGAYAAFRDYGVSVAPSTAPPPPPSTSIAPATLPGATVGAAYAQTITVSGPTPPYMVRVTQGALTPGLVLLSNGTLSGIPTAAGTFAFTVSAFNATGAYSAFRDYTIVVAATPVTGVLSWLTDDFELGIRAPWYMSGSSSQFAVVPGFSGQGVKITNYATSAGPNSASQMAALWLGTSATLAHAWQGQDAWYRFRVYFPADYQATTGQWNWVAEWHNDNTTMSTCGSSAVSVALGVFTDYPVVSNTVGKNPRLALRLGGGSCATPQRSSFQLPLNSLKRGHWYDMLFHYVWSTSSTAGLAEWWIDGQQQVSTRFPTLYTRPDGTPSVNTFGFYNYRLTANWTASIVYDRARIGPSLTSVE